MMMEKKNKSYSIKGSLYFTFLVPATILIFILVGALVLSSVYIRSQNSMILIVLVIFVVILSFLYVLAMMFAYKGIKAIYLDGLFDVTRDVLKDFQRGQSTDSRYPENVGIKEFDELNNELESINVTFNNATLISHDLDNSMIPLEHIYDDDHFVTLESFKKNSGESNVAPANNT